jgi:hypothetical protein
MSHFLITVGVVIAVIAIAAPIAAAFLVSVGSRREESKRSLSGQAPGPIARTARRLLAYRSQTGTASSTRAHQSHDWPVPAAIEPLTIRLVPDTTEDRREAAGTHAA